MDARAAGLVALTVASVLHEVNNGRMQGCASVAHDPRIESDLNAAFTKAEFMPLLDFLVEEHRIRVEDGNIYKLV
jgi:hypothetical protein